MPKNVGAGERGRLDLDLPIHARVALLAAYVAARRRGRVGPGGKGGKGAGAKRKRKEILGQQARGPWGGLPSLPPAPHSPGPRDWDEARAELSGPVPRRPATSAAQEPQPFTLEELLAHFEAIAATALDNADDDDEAEEEGASGGQGGGAGAGAGAVEGLGKARDASAGSVLSQVAGLLAHGLIAACTLEPLDGPRYRSLVRPPCPPCAVPCQDPTRRLAECAWRAARPSVSARSGTASRRGSPRTSRSNSRSTSTATPDQGDRGEL